MRVPRVGSSSLIRKPTDAKTPLPADAFEPWFDLMPVGLAWLDARGTLLRANPRFQALTGWTEGNLAQAPVETQQLFEWGRGQAWPAMAPSANAPGRPAAHSRTVRVVQTDGSHLTLVLSLVPWRSAGWHPDRLLGSGTTYLCTLEDRTAADERDLARLQLGTLMNAADAGLATFEAGTASDAPQLGAGRAAAGADSPPPERWASKSESTGSGPGSSLALQSINRELVTPDSREAFARVQAAVRQGDAVQARYAIQHPTLGRRWLLTRVEPGTTASGQQATSVVTLDVTEEHAARQRHDELLRELATILESSPAGIAYLHGLRLMRCNSRFEEMLGLPAGTATGYHLAQVLVSAQHGPRLLTQALRALRASDSYETEVRVDESQGHQRWYALRVRRLGPFDEQVEAVAVLSDITRRKTQERELQQLTQERQRSQMAAAKQAERTRAILDSVLVGIVTVDRGGIQWMNRSARRMFGGDLPDFLGLPMSVAATDDPQHPFRHTGHLADLPEGQAHTFECQVKARDGRVFWVVGNAVLTLADGDERQLTYALLDIERRRQAEARTAQAQASLQRLIEMAPLAITLRDARTLRIQQMNQQAAAIAGLPRERAVGMTPEEMYAPEEAAQMRRDMEAALADSQATQREYRFERGGTTTWWDARYLPLAQPGCPPDQLLLVATDVTEQRLAQKAKLEDAIAQREKLVREVHHRIKNNLQGVAGLLQQIAVNRPEVATVLSEAVGQVQAIAQVYGLQVGASGPLRMRAVVEAIAQSVQRVFSRGMSLAVEGESASEWLLPESESIPIALCLNELLTNAVKHGDGGELSCMLRCAEDAVDVIVMNGGQLPAGFSLERVPSGVTGLGLVRALLPRRSASLSLRAGPTGVQAVMRLVPPGVVRMQPGTPPQEATGQQITLWPQ